MKRRTCANNKERSVDLSSFIHEEIDEIYNYIEFVKSKR